MTKQKKSIWGRLTRPLVISALVVGFTLSGGGFAHADTPSPTPSPNQGNQEQDPALVQTVREDEAVAPKGEKVEITRGHCDLGPKWLDGKWQFMVRDDSGKVPTWRHLEDVVFRVTDKAKLVKPENGVYDFIKAKGEVYNAPQSEIPGVVWLGWNTQDPPFVRDVNGGMNFILQGYQGEGQLVTFLQSGNFGAPKVLWDSTKKEAQPVYVQPNAHTHANWIFTKPGIALLRFTIEAKLNNGQTLSDTKIIRFAVGDAVDAKAALNEPWKTENNVDNAKAKQAEAPSALDRNAVFPVIIAAIFAIGTLLVLVVLFLLLRKQKHRQAEALANSGLTDGEGE